MLGTTAVIVLLLLASVERAATSLNSPITVQSSPPWTTPISTVVLTPAPRAEMCFEPNLLPGTSTDIFKQTLLDMLVGMDAEVTVVRKTTCVLAFVFTSPSQTGTVMTKLHEFNSSAADTAKLGVSSLLGARISSTCPTLLDAPSRGPGNPTNAASATSGFSGEAIVNVVVGCLLVVGVVVGVIMVRPHRTEQPMPQPTAPARSEIWTDSTEPTMRIILPEHD
jgi:hypothetical protein